jgi:uncharacterized protein YlxW (UPF0749 family)
VQTDEAYEVLMSKNRQLEEEVTKKENELKEAQKKLDDY